jgi:hypothetical protein
MPFFGATARRSPARFILAPRLCAGLLGVAATLVLGAIPAAADETNPYDDGPTKPAHIQTQPVESSDKPAQPLESSDKPAPAAEDSKPAPRPQSPAKKRRGGIHPCMTPDPGYGVYDAWAGTGTSMGQVLMPHQGGVTKNGSFDVVFHFHGHEPIRKEFVKAARGIVLVGIDLGIGSGAYSNGFASPAFFPQLLASVENVVAKHAGLKSAKARKIALSSWSAGYGATEQILRQTGGKGIDAVILLDSLHAGYINEQAHSLKVDQIAPFVAFARRAAKKQGFMFMSHSSIIPPGYASTTEVASFVVSTLGGRPKKANRQDVLGLDMIDRFDKGNFHMRGYTGDDKPDHCAHIGLMLDLVRGHLGPRWKTPKGRK